MPLVQCLRGYTERQLVASLYWLEGQLDVPSRTDMYLMMLAAEVRRSYVKSPKSVQIKDFKLKFDHTNVSRHSHKSSKQSKEHATMVSKMAWLGRMHLTGTKVVEVKGVDKSGQ